MHVCVYIYKYMKIMETMLFSTIPRISQWGPIYKYAQPCSEHRFGDSPRLRH